MISDNNELISVKDFAKRSRMEAQKKSCNIITGDETWVHIYNPLKDPQAKVWVPEDGTALVQQRTTFQTKKFMATIFFSKTGLVYSNLDTKEHTVDANYYVESCLGLDNQI